MAKVRAQVAGGYQREVEAADVGELRKEMGAEGYQVSVNGEPVTEDSYQLRNGDFVSFSKPVKAG